MRMLGYVIAFCSWIMGAASASEIIGRGETYSLRADLPAGALEIVDPGGQPLVTVSPLAGIAFTDGQRLNSSDMTARVETTDPLRVKLTHPRAELTVTVVTESDRVEFRGDITCKNGVVMHVAIPHTFFLEGRPRTRFLLPRVLGCELSERFLSSDGRQAIDYPPAFCDFSAAALAGTLVYFYRCEGAERPRASALVLRGGNPPAFRHYYRVYVREGERRSLPAFACQIGGELRETLLRYKQECGLGKPLEEKLSPEFLAKWRTMAEAVLLPPLIDAPRVVTALPMPAIIGPHAWMFGGFDRKYPDFLPPNAAYSGEEGFRGLVRVAHEGGHFVRPYVNFTWWCTGWDGAGSQPAPSYVKYGDVALSRNLRGELVYENYSANYGYRVCPAHPTAIERRLDVRDALLDDYGVDFLYEDQLGARRWPSDLNPALENPADYGWALMRIGREDAARRPVETECGHDQALAFACALNYWMLPPLSPVNVLPGRAPAQLPEGHRRSFPYALFLSSGDAVVNIPNCTRPDRLAWAMLLGGRVALGHVRLSVAKGPDRDRAIFLQTLARELGTRAIGSRLMDFEYLAPRVARSPFERHHVTANFGSEPWILADGTKIAPDGFDLQASDGFRAGRYVGTGGEYVLAILPPNDEAALTLAAGGFDVTVGSCTLRAHAPPTQHTVTGRRAAIMDLSPGLAPPRDDSLGANALAETFTAFAPIRMRSPADIARELPACRVLVNPHRQRLVAGSLAEWPEALARLRDWCEAGGILVELGGWPLWCAAAPEDGKDDWARIRIRESGFEGLCGERCQVFAMSDGRSDLRLTDLGRAVFSADTAQRLTREGAFVTRPPLTLENSIVLCESDRGGYLVVHPTGYGAVVRVAGVPTDAAPTAVAEIVEAILDGRVDLAGPAWRIPMCRRVEAARN